MTFPFVYFLVNKQMSRFENGGDLAFGNGENLWLTAVGDPEGKPVAQTGW